MEVVKTKQGDILILSLSGRVDSDTAPDFEKEVLEAIDNGEIHIVINCQDLQYISSSGLRVFLLALKAVRPLNGEVAVCSPREHVRDVFDIVGFIGLFAIYDSVDDAFKQLTQT